ncbi:MAG TPA: hypothetical protein VFA38_10095 [Nitrospirales bacterium]|nr:hypothetical protein [Nitrospirales bacterium]
MTAAEAAESLYGAAAKHVAAETLETYGIEPTEHAAHVLARELVGLSVYWIINAVAMMHKPGHAQRIFEGLRARISGAWQSELGHTSPAASFWEDWQARREVYDRLNREGAGPMAIAAETADHVIAVGAVPDSARQSVIALFLDLVPVDELGELVAEIRLTD